MGKGPGTGAVPAWASGLPENMEALSSDMSGDAVPQPRERRSAAALPTKPDAGCFSELGQGPMEEDLDFLGGMCKRRR